MKTKEKSQLTDQKPVIKPETIPDSIINGIAYRVLEKLKTDKDLQAQYESATGKTIFK